MEQKEKRANEDGDEGSNDTDRNTSETSCSNTCTENDEATTARMSGGNDDDDDAMVHGGASMDVETGGQGLDPKEYKVDGSTLGIDGADDSMEDRDTNTSMDGEVGKIASGSKDSGGVDATLCIAGNDSDSGGDGGDADDMSSSLGVWCSCNSSISSSICLCSVGQ